MEVAVLRRLSLGREDGGDLTSLELDRDSHEKGLVSLRPEDGAAADEDEVVGVGGLEFEFDPLDDHGRLDMMVDCKLLRDCGSEGEPTAGESLVVVEVVLVVVVVSGPGLAVADPASLLLPVRFTSSNEELVERRCAVSSGDFCCVWRFGVSCVSGASFRSSASALADSSALIGDAGESSARGVVTDDEPFDRR